MTELEDFISTWAEAERTGDAEKTAGLLTEDFVGVGPVGFQLPKSAWLGRLSHGDLTYETLSLDEVSVREYGECAVINARWNAVGSARGHAIPEAARTTMVCVRQHGEWRLAGIHYSFIAGTAGAPPLPGQK